jgi:hypothetical protein
MIAAGRQTPPRFASCTLGLSEAALKRKFSVPSSQFSVKFNRQAWFYLRTENWELLLLRTAKGPVARA